MKQNTNIKTLIFAAAVSLGVATAASAQSTATAPEPATREAPAGGLLGSRYTGVEYDYLDFSGAGLDHAHGLAVNYNQPVSANFDFGLGYDWARAHDSGIAFTQQDLDVRGTYYTSLGWGKPFALAAAGWDWAHGGGARDDSFVYKLGVGVEVPVAPAFTVAPFATFVRATNYNQSEFDFGVKAEYRVTREWGVMARAQYDVVRHDSDQAEYALGVNYHF
jgi:hypothetical protein